MNKKLAFVLCGGGSRGALEVGALRALYEAGYRPDLITGTSIGAANGAFLAVNGYTKEGLNQLEQVWRNTVDQDLLPTNLWWQTMRAFFRRTHGVSQQRIREFAISNGLTPNLRFADLGSLELYLVAADLKSARPVVFGLDRQELVLDSVLASMALPPWVAPYQIDGQVLVDGGAVSNLPIETAVRQGATEIIALDLHDPNENTNVGDSPGDLFWKLIQTVGSRETQLEIELAQARGIPVRHIRLTAEPPVPIWDFRHSLELIERGYQLTCQAIQNWPVPENGSWWRLEIGAMLEDLIEVL